MRHNAVERKTEQIMSLVQQCLSYQPIVEKQCQESCAFKTRLDSIVKTLCQTKQNLAPGLQMLLSFLPCVVMDKSLIGSFMLMCDVEEMIPKVLLTLFSKQNWKFLSSKGKPDRIGNAVLLKLCAFSLTKILHTHRLLGHFVERLSCI